MKNVNIFVITSILPILMNCATGWYEGLPDTQIVYYIDSSVPEEYHEAIQKAAQEWDSLLPNGVFIFGGVVTSHFESTHERDGRNIIYWITDNWTQYGDIDKLAIAIGHMHYGARVETDVIIDAEFHDFTVGDIINYIDMQSLMTHEFGHMIGFDENYNSKRSVMYPYLNCDYIHRTLSAEDINTFQSLYTR
jgi:hypothetical protein